MEPLPEPERRVLMAAMRELWQLARGPMFAEQERREAKLAALCLAIEERLGHEPTGDEVITTLDERRAEEILAMYPRSEPL
jgi:hypothetical protein